MNFKFTLAAALCFTLSIQAFARDLRPTTGDIMIVVQPKEVHGISGALIRLCDWNRAKNTYSNCKKIGKREFYTENEIESVGRQLAIGKAASIAGISAQASAPGMFLGLAIALVTAPASGGTSLMLAGYVFGGGAITSLGTAGLMSHMDEDGTRSVRRGIVNDENLMVDRKQFNIALETLKAELNELQ